MSERDNCVFYDIGSLKKTEGIEKRANPDFIRSALAERFPQYRIESICVDYYGEGKYGRKPKLFEKWWGSRTLITGLPPFYEIMIMIRTGEYCEELIVWTPLAWNERFAGTAGGGTGIGGRIYLTAPDNATRGWTVPYAVMNGFTAATMDAGNQKELRDRIQKEDGAICEELYENWRVRSTHDMTVLGKAVAEILHERTVVYAYMNGGSGGGRQSLMEMQNYPKDYDGIWAACPAIYWNRFLLGGLWPTAVMNEYHHFLTAEKNRFFAKKVREAYGGDKTFYSLYGRPSFDACTLVGEKCKKGEITEKDAHVMNEIWAGPHRKDGTRLWYMQYPGSVNWQKGIPIGTYYYPLFSNRKVRAFSLGTTFARWITGDSKADFSDIDIDGFEKLFDVAEERFRDCAGDSVDLDAFIERGGKLIIDHGTDDPLIPVEDTIHYYEKMIAHYGKEKADRFCRLYITPGDNHGNCWGNGPGIPESEGMTALINWVEKGVAPETLRTIRIDRKTEELMETGSVEPFDRAYYKTLS